MTPPAPGQVFVLVALLFLTGCEALKSGVDELRHANPYSEVQESEIEYRRARSTPQCWWEQPYQTVCERARVGGGEVCRPVPAGQPFMRCVGAGPQFPYSQNRR